MPRAAQANRAFLRRAVRFLAEQGVRQFLDIGSGIPTVGNVHEVAQAAAPDARVVYVDNDPVAVAHSPAILAGDANRGRRRPTRARPRCWPTRRDRPARLHPPGRAAAGRGAALRAGRGRPARHPRPLRRRASPRAAGWSSRTAAPTTAPGVAMMEQLYEQTSPRSRCAAGASWTSCSTDVDLVDPGIEFLPAWRPDHPDDVAGDAELGQRLRRGGSVDVTVAARPDQQPVPLRAPALRGLRPGAGPGGPGDQLRRARPGRARRLPRRLVGGARPGAVGGAVQHVATAYELGSDLIAAHFTGPEISGRLVKVLGTRLLPDLGLDREPYRSRLAALLGAATTGYARALKDRALDDQETIAGPR